MIAFIALLDATGLMVTQFTYEPFGKTSTTGAANTNGFQYTGRENDNTGLFYYRARYYNSALGRFISEDPLQSSKGLNLYEYSNDNPVDFNDPSGLSGSRPGGPYHPPAGVHTACTPADNCERLIQKMWILKRMINSHTGWDRTMAPPRGGGRHAVEIGELWVQYAKCQSLFQKKCLCTNPSPSPTPFLTLAALIALIAEMFGELWPIVIVGF